jgi:hypothetical protein
LPGRSKSDPSKGASVLENKIEAVFGRRDHRKFRVEARHRGWKKNAAGKLPAIGRDFKKSAGLVEDNPEVPPLLVIGNPRGLPVGGQGDRGQAVGGSASTGNKNDLVGKTVQNGQRMLLIVVHGPKRIGRTFRKENGLETRLRKTVGRQIINPVSQAKKNIGPSPAGVGHYLSRKPEGRGQGDQGRAGLVPTSGGKHVKTVSQGSRRIQGPVSVPGNPPETEIADRHLEG